MTFPVRILKVANGVVVPYRRCRATPALRGSPRPEGSLPHAAPGRQDERWTVPGRSRVVAGTDFTSMRWRLPQRPISSLGG
jgi:hypothetical protein